METLVKVVKIVFIPGQAVSAPHLEVLALASGQKIGGMLESPHGEKLPGLLEDTFARVRELEGVL